MLADARHASDQHIGKPEGGLGPDASPVIEARGLAKHFGPVVAVDGIDLQVQSGETFGFLGPNGAGKTTTIRLLLALIRPTHGEVCLFGEPVRPGSVALARVGALVERPAFYPYLSATENLSIFAFARGLSVREARERIGAALERTGLSDAASRRTGGFSTGMKQRLALALALLDRPSLIILDEPTNGLDPGGVVEVRELIDELAGDGATIFLSSHVLTEVEQLCDRIAILQHGRVVAAGVTRELLAKDERMLVQFDSPSKADAGSQLLATAGWSVETIPGGTLIDARAGDAAEIARLLGEASLYPSELTVRRRSLESVFLELTEPQHPEPPVRGTDR